MSISQVAAVKKQINPTANRGFYLAVFKNLHRSLSYWASCDLPPNEDRVHQLGINFKADIKAYHMMKDFPLCGLQWDVLNPVCVRGYARVRAHRCLFTGRQSLRLLQVFPRNINLGGGTEREWRVIFKHHIFESFWRRQAEVEGAKIVKIL